MTITRHGRRFWRVCDADGALVCVTVYKRGAEEVVRRLTAARAATSETEETMGKKGED